MSKYGYHILVYKHTFASVVILVAFLVVLYLYLNTHPTVHRRNTERMEASHGKDVESPIIKTFLKSTNKSLASNNFYPAVNKHMRKGRKFSRNKKSRSKNTISGCQIPILDPFDPEILPNMKPTSKYNCTKDNPLLFCTDLKSNLIINGSISDHGFTNCCYKELFKPSLLNYIERTWNDGLDLSDVDNKQFSAGNCTMIKENVTRIPDQIEFIAVFCREKRKPKKFKIIDIFAFIHPENDIQEMMESLSTQSLRNFKALHENRDSQANDNVNIIIFMIDSFSHLDFIRTMPKTNLYIKKKLSSVVMNGYSTVGADTLSNTVPIFTGRKAEECNNSNGAVDDCPWISKNFSEMGYRTIYGDDAPRLPTFNNSIRGFETPSTDLDLKLLATEKLFPKSLQFRFCYRPRLAFQILLHHVKKSTYNFWKNEKYIQLVKCYTISQDHFGNPGMADDILLETLTWLRKGNFLNKTVFILMSSRGMVRKPSDALLGTMENKHPLLYFIFPEWLSKKYPRAVSSLKLNSHRLTTPFDLHETIKDLGQLQNIKNSQIHRRNRKLSIRNTYSLNMPRGISLFQRIPKSRTCSDAGIPNVYCICSVKKQTLVNIEEEKLSAASEIVKIINKKLIPYAQCIQWKFEKIIKVEELISEDKRSAAEPRKVYIISVITQPGSVSFEAKVSQIPGKKWYVSKQIRSSLNEELSDCIDIQELKQFCYCLSKISIKEYILMNT